MRYNYNRQKIGFAGIYSANQPDTYKKLKSLVNGGLRMSSTAKRSAKERVASLLDENSFVEIGALVTKRSTDFNLGEKEVPATVR